VLPVLTRSFLLAIHTLLAASPEAPDRVSQAAVFRELWRVELTSPVLGVPRRARVLTQYGHVLTLEDAFSDVGQQDRLLDRARQKQRLESGLDPAMVQRGVVLTVAALLGGTGVLGVLGGAGVLVLTAVLPAMPSGLEWFTELPRTGPILLAGGLVLLAAGVVAGAVGGALTAYQLARPPPPDAAILDALGAEVLWDVEEAKEVVKLHNQRTLTRAGLTEPPAGVPLVPVVEAPVAPESDVAAPADEKPAEKSDTPEKKPTRGKGRKGKTK
jgi:hypothetical protein